MESPSPDRVAAARGYYAEDLRFKTRMNSPALFEAFATVPRERFVGPGPWLIQSWGEHWNTGEADPRHVYHDTLIALDENKHINNGQPSLWAYYLDRLNVRAGQHVLHLGCGTGYYTAILAELAGREGKVVGVEIEPELAERARVALAPWPQVTVLCQDGSRGPFDAADAVVASAGATHPMPAWLAAIKPGGKLLFPLTTAEGTGIMALLTRVSEESFAARLQGGVSFIDFQGASDPETGNRLADLLRRDSSNEVRALRLDAHNVEESCWLHGTGWCFSRREPIDI
ncbi:MAG: protein-L-isoaspartate O-methyltransferase family protein [Terracidiphilus sp.]